MPDLNNKLCCRCHKEYPATVEFFSKQARRGVVGLTSQCKSCRSLMWKEQYEKNRSYYVKRSVDRIAWLRKNDPAYAQLDREKSRDAKRKLLSIDAGRDHHNALQRQWRRENPERARTLKHELPAAKAYRAMVRYARKRNALPRWANKAEILSKYEDARRITDETGIPHEVDHIVPLAGKEVCGLHVACNLAVITAEINRSKGNKLIF